MNLESGINMTGSLTIKHYDLDGKLIGDLTIPNLVVTAGKEYVANRMVRNDMAPMSYMAIGQSTTASAATQTTLLSEAQRASIVATSLNGTSITYSSTFTTVASAINMTEAGIFNQASTKSVTFDANNAASATSIISPTVPALHTFATGDQVRYSNGGGTSVGGLVDGNIYYVIATSTTQIKLALTSANATAGTAIAISPGTGTAHKLTFGTMMCRTTFPTVTKSTTDTVVISWTVTVG